MKHLLTSLLLVFSSSIALAQVDMPSGGIPITVTVFSESVSLPNFKNIFKNGSLGVRIGTELYYSKKDSRQLMQTINLSYYSHKDLHNAFSLTSEFGYRRFFGNAFADATVGVGYMLIHSAMPRYENVNGDFIKASSTFGRFAPSIGLGAGYQFKNFSAFTRYEMFGEMPFGFKGIPALPHKTIHIGTRLNLK
ncbi:MAG: hypothetical protein MUF39_07495 [Cyclobacteriaceae bacterium]|nr:hypothetical protein [Cyclobacteriaceae bacterium]